MGMDLIGPLPETTHGNKYIVILTDYFSKLAEVKQEYEKEVSQGDVMSENSIERSAKSEEVEEKERHMNEKLEEKHEAEAITDCTSDCESSQYLASPCCCSRRTENVLTLVIG